MTLLFFDQVIEKCKEYDLKVMMCVPTATMPRWLNLKYPEIMAKDEFGHSQPFGGRRGYCYNSDIYLQKALSLTAPWLNIIKTKIRLLPGN